jgi:hypothetical protein
MLRHEHLTCCLLSLLPPTLAASSPCCLIPCCSLFAALTPALPQVVLLPVCLLCPVASVPLSPLLSCLSSPRHLLPLSLPFLPLGCHCLLPYTHARTQAQARFERDEVDPAFASLGCTGFRILIEGASEYVQKSCSQHANQACRHQHHAGSE